MHTPVTFAGRDLSEFGAKLQSWPEITACDVDTGTFWAADHNTIHLLQQRRGGRRFTCRIDFWGQPREWTANISVFSALVSTGTLEIDIMDGYLYQAILLSESTPVIASEVIATVEYQFRAVRHWPAEHLQINTATTDDTPVICHSNYPLTDCKIELPFAGALSTLDGVRLVINDKAWEYPLKPTGSIVLDGIRKTYAMGSTIISTTLRWTDFPALRPGRNEISVYKYLARGEGGRVSVPMYMQYTPTFL